MRKNAPREAKNGPAGLKSEPGWTKMGPPGPLLRTLDAFLATWGVPLCMFMHFYQVFVNTCAFLMKINGKTTKIQQIAEKITNVAQKHTKSD